LPQAPGLAVGRIRVYSIATSMTSTGPSKLTRFAWLYYAYLLFVILFGAWVRISGSGAGCGGSWPTCRGELVPPSAEAKTLIEYAHRATSGTLGLLSVALVAWVFKARTSRRCKVAALVTLCLVLVEALIGAGLVLRELVANDASVARAVVIALHLGNTLVLAAAAGLVALWSAPAVARTQQNTGWLWGSAGLLLAFALVSMAGAVTALGDTLFPVAPALESDPFQHVAEGLSSSRHFLIQLRIVHPLLALALTGGLLVAISHWRTSLAGSPSFKWLRALNVLTYGQVALGVLNIAFGAPTLMQLLHLLLAHLLWLCLVVVTLAR
jgi:heme A synthase